MARVRAWLPAAALDAGLVHSLLASAIEPWSRKWFARRRLRLLDSLHRGAAGRVSAEGPAWHVLEEGLAVGVAARLPIAAALLDHGINERTLSGADRALIEALADSCLADLRERLCHHLRLPPDLAWRTGEAPAWGQSGWSCVAGIESGEALIHLSLDEDLFVSLVKHSVRTAPTPLQLRPIAEGLALQPVSVSAFVGACDLTLRDIAGLAPGDVLVLDREREADLELALDVGSRSGRCSLQQQSGRLVLEITETVS